MTDTKTIAATASQMTAPARSLVRYVLVQDGRGVLLDAEEAIFSLETTIAPPRIPSWDTPDCDAAREILARRNLNPDLARFVAVETATLRGLRRAGLGL